MKIISPPLLIFLITSAFAEEAYLLQKFHAGKFYTLAEKNPQIVTMPGSLFKLLTAVYLLEKDKNIGQRKVNCQGGKSYGKKCWTLSGHGIVDLEKALAYSCNLYFYKVTKTLSREDYLLFLKKEFSFPADIQAYSEDVFIGETFSRPLSFREIGEIFNFFYRKLAEERYPLIESALVFAKRGTLANLVSKLEKKTSLKIIGGKTGSTNWTKKVSGIVYLLLKNSQGEDFTLLFYHKGTMGAKIPEEKILSVLKKIKP